MPLYEYQCKNCKRIYEELQSINASMSVQCECGGLAERVLFSGFSARTDRKSPIPKFEKPWDYSELVCGE